MTRVVGDPGLCLDDLGHALERPHVGGVAVFERTLHEPPLHTPQVGRVELGQASCTSGTVQSLGAARQPVGVPPAHTLARHPELPHDVSL
jgi:hypothetical protein